MQWVAIVLMIIRFLRELKKAESKEAFMASPVVKEIGDGKIIEWLWENREEILAFVLKLIEMFSKKPVLYGGDVDAELAEAVRELIEE